MISLHVACNDPDNGLFAYRAEFLELGGEDRCEFEAKRAPAPRFVETENGFRLAGKNWDCDSSRQWVGNWCWNTYHLWPRDPSQTHRWYLVEFLTWLKGRELFHLHTAPTPIFEWWHGEIELTPARLHSEICDLEDTHD